MVKILLIRTCETVANKEGRISNYAPLTPNGIKQAEKTKDSLKFFDICSIYSSTLDSACKTAEIIAHAFYLSVIKYPEFNETDLGDWDGMKKVDISKHYRKEWEEWLNNPTKKWKFPGARETLEDVQERAINKLKEIVSSHKETDFLCIVTHGNIIRVILCLLLNIDLSNILKLHQFNGAVTTFEYDGVRVKIHSINDICHLHPVRFSDSITGKPWEIKD